MLLAMVFRIGLRDLYTWGSCQNTLDIYFFSQDFSLHRYKQVGEVTRRTIQNEI